MPLVQCQALRYLTERLRHYDRITTWNKEIFFTFQSGKNVPVVGLLHTRQVLSSIRCGARIADKYGEKTKLIEELDLYEIKWQRLSAV